MLTRRWMQETLPSSPQEGPTPIVLHSSRDLSDEFVQMYPGKLPAPGTGLASANHSGPGPGLARAPLHREPWMHFWLFTAP